MIKEASTVVTGEKYRGRSNSRCPKDQTRLWKEFLEWDILMCLTCGEVYYIIPKDET